MDSVGPEGMGIESGGATGPGGESSASGGDLSRDGLPWGFPAGATNARLGVGSLVAYCRNAGPLVRQVVDVEEVYDRLMGARIVLNACIESDVFMHRLDPQDLWKLGLTLIDPMTGMPLTKGAQDEILESIWEAGEGSDDKQVLYG